MRITRMAFSSCIEGRAGFDRTCVGTSVASDGGGTGRLYDRRRQRGSICRRGLSAGLRDLGRLGLALLDEGVINGKRLFPAEVVRKIRKGAIRRNSGRLTRHWSAEVMRGCGGNIQARTGYLPRGACMGRPFMWTPVPKWSLSVLLHSPGPRTR